MKKKISIKFKISASALIVSIVYSIIIGSFSIITFGENLKKYKAMGALDIANTISTNIDGDIISYLPVLIIIMLVSCVSSYLLISLAASKIIVTPIKKMEEVSSSLAESKFDISLPDLYLQKNDEIGSLSRSYMYIAENLKSIIKDIADVLYQMEKKNLDVEIGSDYKGDCAPIKNSINQIIYTYNQLLNQIHAIADEISIGSEQVSSIATNLAQGSTEQASSIEQMYSSFSTISQGAVNNAENVEKANNYITEITSEILKCNEDMQQTHAQ